MLRIFLILITFACFASALSDKGTLVKEPIFNASIYMRTLGNPLNPALVLVHGLGDEASSIWDESIAVLQKEYYVITFDLPGFGQSSKSNELYSPKNYALFMHYLSQNYIKRPFHLIGHSMGGAIALQYAYLYKEDVLSLVLVDVAGMLHRFAYNQFLVQSGVNHFFEEQPSLIQGLQTTKLDRFINKMTAKFDRKTALDMDAVLASERMREVILGAKPSTIAAVALVQSNFNGIVHGIQAKTTLIWGDKDTTAPLQTGYVLNKLIPHSQLLLIPNAAHSPMLTHPKEFLSTLQTHFLSLSQPFNTIQTVSNPEAYSLTLKNVSDKHYTGTITSLSISDSHKITIKDAIIEALYISNSDVEIINSTINKSSSIIGQNARISIVASDVNGTIKLDRSTLHLAGVTIDTDSKPIVAISPSSIIYSLCTINNNFVHGQEMLGLK